MSIELIILAYENGLHLLCLPAHTTHILQPFDVDFSTACHKYLLKHPGRAITTDVIASLVAEAWPLSLTPLNVMSGFKKCEPIYPINPGKVNDRQLAPSKSISPQNDKISEPSSESKVSESAIFTIEEQKSLDSLEHLS